VSRESNAITMKNKIIFFLKRYAYAYSCIGIILGITTVYLTAAFEQREMHTSILKFLKECICKIYVQALKIYIFSLILQSNLRI